MTVLFALMTICISTIYKCIKNILQTHGYMLCSSRSLSRSSSSTSSSDGDFFEWMGSMSICMYMFVCVRQVHKYDIN